MGCRAFALLVAPPDVRPCSLPRQISGRRAACPPARRPRRELRSARRLVVRPGPAGLAAASNRSGCLCGCPGQAPPPPTGTAAGPSGALHTSGALSLTCCWLLCLEARPGPAAAHRHRGCAHRTFRHRGQARWTFRHRSQARWTFRHRGQARWTFRRPPAPRLCPPDLPAPPYRRCLRCGVWPGASTRCPARPRRPPALRPVPPPLPVLSTSA